jgi:tRNA U34 5-methylaminomethyl-2-thiouridine-forming methyltransferase MnmC
LNREIIHTLDGSTTIQIKEWDECYHSKHGAIQEAQHVFLKNGLSLFQNKQISILEIGFGTGLNAFITFLKEQNESINRLRRGGSLSGFRGRTGFHELRRRIEC